MKIRRSTALLAGGVVLAMTAAACGGGSGSSGGSTAAAQGPKGTITWGEGTDVIQNFLPIIAAGNSTATANIMARMLLVPFRVYPDFTVHYDQDLLAAEPTADTVGGKFTVTYKINPKAVWSDGQAITWQDFQFSWDVQKSSDPAKGGCAALLTTTGYDLISGVAQGADDHTAVVTYSKPYGDWKAVFSPGFLPKHIMDKGDPKATCEYITKGWPLESGIPEGATNGPWVLLKSGIDTQNKNELLTPNPKWWGPKTGLEKIVFQYQSNDVGVVVKNLKSGQVNVVYPQPGLDLVKQIKDLPNVTSEVNFGLSFEHLDLNTRNVHLAHPEIRKAIALAMDRAAIVAGTVGQFDSRATVLNNRMYVNNQPEYKDNSGGMYSKPDVAAAKKLIESIGYKMGPDGIYVSPAGKRLSLDTITTVGNKLRENTIDLMASQLKPAGIEIKKDLDPDIFAGKEKPKSLEAGGFDIALFAWVSSPFLTSSKGVYYGVKGDAQGQNYTHGSDPKVDSLLDQIDVATDSTKAAELANQTDTQLWADMYSLPLYQKPTFIAFSSTYTPYDPATHRGIGDNATNSGPHWNDDTWTVKQ